MKYTNINNDNILYWITLSSMILFMGLFYQEAWQYPVIDSFPLIERLLNPEYLTNDFYTNTFNEFSPRLILASCISWVSETLNIHYSLIVAYANILRIWLYSIALYLLFKELSNRQVALIALTLSSLSFLSVPFLPAWWPVTFDFTASNVALVFSMFSWVKILQNKVTSALVLLTGAVIFHPLVGVHSLLIALILFFNWHGWHHFLLLFKKPTVYIAGLIYSSAFLALYLSFDKAVDNETFIEINGLYRHGHHFIFSHMDIEKWISTFLMITISLMLLFTSNINIKLKRLCLSVFTYAGFLTVLGYVFVELIPTRFMVSFIPMRAFPIIVPIIVLIWASFAWQRFKKNDYLSFLVLLIPFLPFDKVGLTWFIFPNSHELLLPLIMTFLSILLVTANILKPILFGWANSIILGLIERGHLKNQPAMFILPVALLGLTLAVTRFELAIPTKDTDPDIYSWLEANTSKADIVMSELNAANNQKIRLLSQRAVVVSKDFPFNEKFYIDWYRRYQSIYKDRDSARGHIDSQKSGHLNTLMDHFNVNILVRTQPLEPNPHLYLIGESQGEVTKSYIYRNQSLGGL